MYTDELTLLKMQTKKLEFICQVAQDSIYQIHVTMIIAGVILRIGNTSPYAFMRDLSIAIFQQDNA